MKTVRLIFTFYKGFMLPALLITGVSIIISAQFGLATFLPLLLLKLGSLAFIFFFNNDYRKNQFYYFSNLGLSRSVLWFGSLGFDFLLFLVSLITAYSFR